MLFECDVRHLMKSKFCKTIMKIRKVTYFREILQSEASSKYILYYAQYLTIYIEMLWYGDTMLQLRLKTNNITRRFVAAN